MTVQFGSSDAFLNVFHQKLNRIVVSIMVVSYCAGIAYRAAVCCFFILVGTYSQANADSLLNAGHKDVTIVLSERNDFYEDFGNTLDRLLTGTNISHRVIDATQPISEPGLVIAVGLKAATVVASSNAPAVINVLISKSSHEKLLRDFPARAGSPSMSAIYLNQPVQRQAHLITAIFPGKHNVGLLYSTPSKEIDEIRQVFRDHSLMLLEQKIDQTQTLPMALQELFQGRSEMLFTLPDSGIYNDLTIRNILVATYRRGIPLIGLSAAYVKAGAICAIFSTPTQIAVQTAKLILKFNETHILPTPQFPREFEVLVNVQVANSLGLQVKDASAIHDEIDHAMTEIP